MEAIKKVRLETELASLKMRREAVLKELERVEELKAEVLWSLNNNWLNLMCRLRDYDRWIRERESALCGDVK